MDFQLLGPFAAHHEGRPVPVGSRRQERCLLAVLLLHAGRVVATERLIDLLWDDTPPASARATVHTYVGRLRAALKPYGVIIASKHDGYAVEHGQHRIDAQEFTSLAGRAATAADPAERTRLYDDALGLWRGEPLADVADERLRTRLGGTLAELRLSAVEQRAEAQLALGLHDRVAADLTPLLDEHPTRERLVAARMTALYRSGRQADALRLYDGTRTLLATELGIEPNRDLRTLHDRMLHGDPRLDRPPGPVYAVRVDDQWLPWSTSGHPALEFCNTYAGWGGDPLPGSEWLRGYAAFAVWAGHLDLIEERTVTRLRDQAVRQPAEAAAALDEARRFRTDLYTCLTDPQDGRAFKAVAGVVEDAARLSVFTRGEDGLARWRPSPSTGLRLPLYAVARNAAELLADARRFTIRTCSSPDCGWLFLDESGRRRWCSLATCGAKRMPEGC
ncbi:MULTISPECIES: BTAD domain-containing putative transcriptional regulator [Streptomyces]|uniref:ABATE domain-containing protein n=1 Tax=Streptomyces koelreuteriae TaxID=2838015 RepID=A0ABX8FSZ0_9ACTN|nr:MULTISPECIES: BTAD domain-containing putative transcriptional regulator [Streptomyces]QWB24305.1 ABATE domain-containing protein [Streptomyces koelreuteriae]UUA07305.1 ABATE domain-containing protein [Streptomyces koelreuteriae]UUA14934.1 ABATE domain-containing protein [Streptomyces sp. CRCS-T-1]